MHRDSKVLTSTDNWNPIKGHVSSYTFWANTNDVRDRINGPPVDEPTLDLVDWQVDIQRG